MTVDVVIGLDSLALVLAIGLWATQVLLVPVAGLARHEQMAVQRAARRWLGLFLTLLWFTSLAWLWTRTAAMSGQPAGEALSAIPVVLLHSHFGAVWWLRAAALAWATLALVVLLRRDHASRASLALLLLGLAWVAASRSAAGHAAANGDWTLRELVDWAHLMAISVWGGTLITTLLLIFPRLPTAPTTGQARFAARFSLIATAALAVVLLSGSYNAWRMLPTMAAFWTSVYGGLLGIKLLFVAAMVACGAVNHYRLVPRLQSATTARPATIRRLQRSVLTEAILLLIVLSITALLLGSMPPQP